jgi:protocatechuate 3,4-dioxygenase beta subunit
VTAASDGHPLHRVKIVLNGAGSNLPAGVTDERGVFELADVPPGTYTMTASRGGYLTTRYGQRRPLEAGRTIVVASGETVEGIDLRLARGAVLAGRVTDEAGEPLPGARVEAVELRYLKGRRVAVPARVAYANDEGDYRLSDLETGTYQVRASSTDLWEANDPPATFAFAVTYYPGVLGSGRPESFAVVAGQQVAGLDFRLLPGAASRIAGVIQSAGGDPLPGQVVYLSRITRTVGGELFSSGAGSQTRTDERGAFEFSRLAPGEYLAIAGGPNDTTTMTVVLEENDSRQVVLTPRRASAATGSVVSEDGTPFPFPASRLKVSPIPTDPALVFRPWGGPTDSQALKADWTFRIGDMDGEYLFRVSGAPDEWMLTRVMVRGRDAIDTPVRLAAGGGEISNIQIVLGRTGGSVAGQVVDPEGEPAPDSTVVVFAENRSLWGLGSRYVRAVRPDRQGRFAATGLPAATYRVAATEAVVEGQWEDREFLETLSRQSIKVELAEKTTEKVTITLEPVR